MRRIAIPSLLLAFGCACGCATTGGVISGRLDLPRSARASAPSPARDRSLADAVVYVEKLPQGIREPAHASPTYEIVANADGFVPRVLAVPAGATVVFRNLDRVYHNAFSISPAKRFDLGKFGPGETRTVTLDRPGYVTFFCELHPSAEGFIAVLPNPVFAQADATGNFVLPPLPEGSYTVTAWHPRFGERHCRVNLPRKGEVSVDLRF